MVIIKENHDNKNEDHFYCLETPTCILPSQSNSALKICFLPLLQEKDYMRLGQKIVCFISPKQQGEGCSIFKKDYSGSCYKT